MALWTSGVDLYVNSTRGIGQYWLYSGIKINENFWGNGEPNDHLSQTRGTETCVDIKIPAAYPGSFDYFLNDEVCTEQLSYICETKIH